MLATLFSFSTGTDHVIGDTGFPSHSADVSGFAGTTVRLTFLESVPEDFTGPAQIEFDAIRLGEEPLTVPEPSSVALVLGLALLYTATLRRRA